MNCCNDFCKKCNIRLLKGDKGDKGDKGERGFQGERGFKGEKGDPGVGLEIKGSLPNEQELPTNAQVGQAYIVNGDLFIYL